MRFKNTKALLVAVSAPIFCSTLLAEEGMWPFNMIPKKQIKETYGLELSEEWIDHIRQASLRISLGGSGSFISPSGLLITNHHVGARAVYDLSTQENNYLDNGFYAETGELELKCPNMHVDQLVSIRDITNEVNQGVSADVSPGDREKMRMAAIAKIKSEAEESTGLYPELVTLYGGAKYHLYLFKRYTDIRLVMAPEKTIAFFGGNEDNFEYPRYALDVCFFRAYENDKPAKIEHYLPWSENGPKENEPLFVSGNPGKTRRLLTADHLDFFQNIELPLILSYFSERIQCLEAFAEKDPEHMRMAAQDLFRNYNGQKAYTGFSQGVQNSSLIERKRTKEKEIPTEEKATWQSLATALENSKSFYRSYMLLEGVLSRYCKSYMFAKLLVRLSDESTKPNEERLKEYVESERPGIERELLSTEPVYKDLETVLMRDTMRRFITTLGLGHPATQAMLGGKTAEARTDEIFEGTTLLDVNVRRRLLENLSEVKTSTDPMILLAKALDPICREVRQQAEQNVESVVKESYVKITEHLFKQYGENVYPDATFSLRMTIGTMKGYNNGKEKVAPFTTLGGTYEHAHRHGDTGFFQVPGGWTKSESEIDKKVPFNFVSTHDIIGGNSGSPVINAKGEFTGIIFDGNIESLAWDCEYSDATGRSVSVHSAGILEALDKIYKAKRLIAEIRQK